MAQTIKIHVRSADDGRYGLHIVGLVKVSLHPGNRECACGFKAENGQRRELEAYLRRIGYRFWSEEGNPAYELFLE